ncbi:molecular chaperone HtpG [Brumimicrobium glaciale]|uniref:Chaperone protein HtpG n=1 Tax=Brumimicrobium glaciale TaxID=200475 RepID=A0A4Q4KIW2_9FLAO|nr:molecular chaperone HtpG [Brumimicrobium glaciale]RYM32597.1 molecular chaperone HtpG [Brumimicrobium glaciale]
MKKGHINVETENIFPIIKKFLYSDHEIFLRELVSNAVDASQKLKVLSKNGEYDKEVGELKVEVILDKAAKTLTIRDNGIGMTADEIDKYINQIAFSGAEEFVQKYKDSDSKESIIGHFGLGFYSAFMVAEKVEIITLGRYDDATPVKWESTGTTEYTIQDTEKATRGTDIILHINEESAEFLEESRVRGILDKYCKFLPVPVIFGTYSEKIDDPKGEKDEEGNVKKVSIDVPNQINNPTPAWTKMPAELSKEDYTKFYRELYPTTVDDPLFHIHLNVDYPFNLTGILYFPKIKENVEVQKNKIQLYSNQVFITDSVEEIVPEFLTLLHGVIDSPDIPLNVSRSYLQSDSNVKKISAHISKKVSDKLKEMFNKDRKDFEEKWGDLRIFSEYGMLSDDKFADRAKAFHLMECTDGKFYTPEEFKEAVKATQTDKDGKTVFLYTNSKDEQYSFVKSANDRGYKVIELQGPLVSHWIQKMESSLDNVSFARVDADTLDKLIQKEENIPSKLSEDEQKELQPIFEGTVNKDKYKVQFESMSETDAPIMVTQPEFIRRMKEQQAMGGAGFFGAFPETYNMIVNSNHPKISSILAAKGEERSQKAKQLTDLAMLSQGMLKGEALTNFVNRSIELV